MSEDVIAIVNDQGFQTAVAQWTALDDRIRGITAQMKPIRKKHRALREVIVAYMDQSNRDVCYINDRREQICLTSRTRKVKLDDEGIRARLLRALNNDQGAADNVYDYMFGDGVEREETKVFGRKLSSFGLREGRASRPGAGADRAAETLRKAEEEMDERIRRNEAFEV